MKIRFITRTVSTMLLLAAIILQSGCSPAVFNYDKAALPQAKPWTSENFMNSPDNFQE
jgi:hypothetical protein